MYLKEGEYKLKSNDVFWQSPSKKYSNLVLRKSLTIIGENKERTVLIVDDSNSKKYSDGSQFVVTLCAPNIVLKNVTIIVNQQNIKSLGSIFNIWGNWDNTTSRNSTIENVDIIVNSPVPYIFYMNDYNLNVRNVTVKSNGNVPYMYYWNYGSITITDSKFDLGNTSGFGSGPVTLINTQFNIKN